MPVYKVVFLLKADSNNPQAQRREVFRQYEEANIEVVWQKLENKCRGQWAGRLEAFDCVMISKRSPDYRKYLGQVKKQEESRRGMQR
jgi:hypothetical protein